MTNTNKLQTESTILGGATVLTLLAFLTVVLTAIVH